MSKYKTLGEFFLSGTMEMDSGRIKCPNCEHGRLMLFASQAEDGEGLVEVMACDSISLAGGKSLNYLTPEDALFFRKQHNNKTCGTMIRCPPGEYGGYCNRGSCTRVGAIWLNSGNGKHYCAECAHLINRHNTDITPPLFQITDEDLRAYRRAVRYNIGAVK